MQALDRTQPGLPLKKGRAATMTHDYKRNGTTTLFAALNVLDGQVIGQCQQRHHHQEFIRFLNAIDAEVPAGKAVHVADLGEALLPAPDHRSADPDRLGDLLYRRAPGRRQNDPRPLHVLPLPPPFPNKRSQPPSIRSAHNHAYCLSHAAKIAWLGALVKSRECMVY